MDSLRFVFFVILTLLVSGLSHAQDEQSDFTGVNARIIGGTATTDTYPWMVSLQKIYGNNQSYHFCGGSLIGSEWVITAAHCLEDETFTSFKMYIGATNQVDGTPGEERTAEWFAIHHDYNSDSLGSDLAIIKLSAASTKTPISLIDQTANQALAQNDSVRVIGWGLTEDGNFNSSPINLLEVDVSFQADSVCLSTYGQPFSGYWDKLICAGEVDGGKDSCQGDSGGPMMLDDSGDWVLTGVVSWGRGCGVSGSFGAYTEVGAFLAWIEERQTGLSLVGPNKIGFLGYGRKKAETYQMINSGNNSQTINSASMSSGEDHFFEYPVSTSSLTVPANSQTEIEINAVGSYLGEHNDELVLNAGGEDFGIRLNAKVLYDLETDVLGVAWEFYSGTNENTEHAEPWFEVNDSEKGTVLRSGIISHEERSILLTYVKGPDSGDLYLKFDSRVDAQTGSDVLLITVNENDSYLVTSNDWQTTSVDLPDDVNRIQFIYIKDDATSAGEDAAYLTNLRVCTELPANDQSESTCSQLDSFNVSDTSATKLETAIGNVGSGDNDAYVDPNAPEVVVLRKGKSGAMAPLYLMAFAMIFLIRSRRKSA